MTKITIFTMKRPNITNGKALSKKYFKEIENIFLPFIIISNIFCFTFKSCKEESIGHWNKSQHKLLISGPFHNLQHYWVLKIAFFIWITSTAPWKGARITVWKLRLRIIKLLASKHKLIPRTWPAILVMKFIYLTSFVRYKCK